MTSALDAIEQASYAALADEPPIGADVYQHVPENTPPPVVIIGDIETTDLGTKGEEDVTGTLAVLTVTEAEERKPCLAIMDQVKSRLNGVTVTVAGWELSFSFVSDNAILTPNGAGYVGTTHFDILASRA